MAGGDVVTVEERLGASCLACGYALRGLTEPRCPECGRPFDPRDPWTMRLPRRPNRLARWLMRPPSRIGMAFPVASIPAVAWGTRVPGWEDNALSLGLILLAASLIATLPWRAVLHYVRDSGYDDARVRGAYQRWLRRVQTATIVVAGLVIFRPTMFACFWISRPFLDRVARDVLARPFEKSTPYIGETRGSYFVGDTRRCPHGVKLKVTRGWWYGDSGTGFIYLPSGKDCVRFDKGVPLGGGWYASE